MFGITIKHGNKGLKRASDFINSLGDVPDDATLYRCSIEYLEDNTNGRTHPHSFRTILLKELLESDESLQSISKNFNARLEKFKKQVSSTTASPKPHD